MADAKPAVTDQEKMKTLLENISAYIEQVHGGWVERKRKTRRGLQQDLGGFVGDITYTGPISEFMPLLMLGQYVHAGKNAVFGGGWYEIIRRNSDR